jgi:hypothetical protein
MVVATVPSRTIGRSNVEKMQHSELDRDVEGEAERIDWMSAAPEFMQVLFSRASLDFNLARSWVSQR